MNSVIEFKAYLAGKGQEAEKKLYYNAIGSFDIETTQYTTFDNKQRTYCYAWTFCIDETLYREGRDPEEFFKFLDELKLDKILVIYVQWLGYEYYNLQKYFNDYGYVVEKKKGNYDILRIIGKKYLFRCSAMLTGRMPLKEMGELVDLPKLELDYDKKRNRNTYLNDEELGYNRRDVAIVCRYVRYLCDFFKLSPNELPNTVTGFYDIFLGRNGLNDTVRKLRAQGKYFPEKGNNGWREDDFDKFNEALKGGLIVINKDYQGKTIDNAIYADISSAYAYVGLSKLPYKFSHIYDTYPIGKQRKLIDDIGNWGVLAKFTFTDLDLKEDANCDFLDLKEYPVETYSAYMTNLEFKMIEMYYDYSSVEWEDLQATPLKEIDKRERKVILDFFDLKENSKGTASYDLIKKCLNSGSFGKKCIDIKKYGRTIDECKFYYPEGVWISSIQRFRMINLIKEIGEDFIYTNTDSIVCRDTERTRKILEDYNNTVVYDKLGKFDIDIIDKFHIIKPSQYIIVKGDKCKVVLSGAIHTEETITLQDFEDISEGGVYIIENGQHTIEQYSGLFNGFIDGIEVESYDSLIIKPISVEIKSTKLEKFDVYKRR